MLNNIQNVLLLVSGTTSATASKSQELIFGIKVPLMPHLKRIDTGLHYFSTYLVNNTVIIITFFCVAVTFELMFF